MGKCIVHRDGNGKIVSIDVKNYRFSGDETEVDNNRQTELTLRQHLNKLISDKIELDKDIQDYTDEERFEEYKQKSLSLMEDIFFVKNEVTKWAAKNGNLIATHNIRGGDLYKIVNRDGKLPAPSIAILNRDGSLTSYGDVTLIGDKSFADPSVEGNNIYSSDMYSQLYPEIFVSLESKSDEFFKPFIERVAPFIEGMNRYEPYNWFSPKPDFNALRNRYAEALLATVFSMEKLGLKEHELKNYAEDYDDSLEFLADVQLVDRENVDRFNKWLRGKLKGFETRNIFYDYDNKAVDVNDENILNYISERLINANNVSTLGAVRAELSNRFGTFEEVKSKETSLINNRPYRKVVREMTDRLDNLRYDDDINYIINYEYSEYDYREQVSAFLIDYVRDSEGFKDRLGEEAKNLINTFLKDLQNAPVRYFENKVTRMVDLSEFKAAVVPYDNETLRELLQAKGLSVYGYHKHIEGQREGVVMKASLYNDLSFQMSKNNPYMKEIEEQSFKNLVNKIKNKFGAGVEVITDKDEFNEIVANSKTIASYQKKVKFDIDNVLSKQDLSEESIKETKKYYDELNSKINKAVEDKDKSSEKRYRKQKKAVEFWINKKGFSMPRSAGHIEAAFELMEKKGVDFMKYDSPFALIDAHSKKSDEETDVNFEDYFENKRVWKTDAGDIEIYDSNDVEKLNAFGRKYFGWDYENNRAKNPWCLCAYTKTGAASESAKNMWNNYSSAQRKIAVLNGKVLAFSANDYDTENDVWWDLDDNQSIRLPLGNEEFVDSDGEITTYDVELWEADPLNDFSYAKDQEAELKRLNVEFPPSLMKSLYFEYFDEVLNGGDIEGRNFLNSKLEKQAASVIDEYLDDFSDEIESLEEGEDYQDDIFNLKTTDSSSLKLRFFSKIYNGYDKFRDHFDSNFDSERVYYEHGEMVKDYELVDVAVYKYLNNRQQVSHYESEVIDSIFSIDFDSVMYRNAADVEGTNLMTDKEGVIYGAQVGNKIYLNPEHMNANTPVHEFSHLWAKLNPSLFRKGIESFKKTKVGQELFEQISKNSLYSDLGVDKRWEEALVSFLGNKGEEVYHKAKDKDNLSKEISKEDRNFFQWVVKFFDRLFEAVKSLFSKSSTKPEVHSFKDFTKDVLHQVMGEKKLSKEKDLWDEHDPMNTGFLSDHEITQKEDIPSETFKDISNIPFVGEKQALDIYKHLYNNSKINNWVNEKLDC